MAVLDVAILKIYYEGTQMSGELVCCAFKEEIICMTRYLRSHFGHDGIRANSLYPGGIFDEQNKDL